MMQAYKVKGKVDAAGRLMLSEPVNLPAGEVEVFIVSEVEKVADNFTDAERPVAEQLTRTELKSSSNIFSEWLAQAKPVSPDFDEDAVRWEALKEKHGL